MDQRINSKCSQSIIVVLRVPSFSCSVRFERKSGSIYFVVNPLFHHLCSYCYICTIPLVDLFVQHKEVSNQSGTILAVDMHSQS